MSILFGGIRQLGMVVKDAESAMAEWAKMGVGPFFTMRFTMEDFVYRGKQSPGPDVTLCFAHSGPLQIELIQQHNDAPSAYREFLQSGKEGAQHVGAWYSDHANYDAVRAGLIKKGFQLVHEGGYKAADARFSYFESAVPGGLMFELSEALMPASAEAIRQMEKAAINWDGKSVLGKPLEF